MRILKFESFRFTFSNLGLFISTCINHIQSAHTIFYLMRFNRMVSTAGPFIKPNKQMLEALGKKKNKSHIKKVPHLK